jgi:hypothetical protein
MTTTEKIMALFDHAMYAEESYAVAAYRDEIRSAVQVLVDERDQWKVDCAEALLERDVLVCDLANIRDLFPIPERDGPHEVEWLECMAYPESVPAYVKAKVESLRKAAQAVVDRWDTPLWKDVPATGEFINALRRELGE